MFGFSRKNDDLIGLNQKVGRFLNFRAKSDLNAEQQRAESRTRLAVPCLVFLQAEIKAPQNYAVGITSDMSLHGLGLMTIDQLEVDDYILVFGPADQRMYVAANCMRCSRADFGTYATAFSFTRILSAKEIAMVAKAVESVENGFASAQNTAAPLQVPVMSSPPGQFAL